MQSDAPAEERLKYIATVLGLAPAGTDFAGRSIYLAYLLAQGADQDQLDRARENLEAVQPGALNRIERFRQQWFR